MLVEHAWDRKFGEPLPTLDDVMREASQDDDDYVSIGWGKYKEKDSVDDPTAPTFKKDDSGAFVPAKGVDKEKPSKEPKGDEEKPKSKGLKPSDFERDFDDSEPDSADGDIKPIDNDKGVKRMAASIEKKTNSEPGSLELQGRTKADDGTLIIQWKDKTDGMLMGISDDGSVYEGGKKTSYKADQDSFKESIMPQLKKEFKQYGFAQKSKNWKRITI